MCVIISGSRSCIDFDFVDKKVEAILNDIYFEKPNIKSSETKIIIVGAKGTDTCGACFAQKHHYIFKKFNPGWNYFGSLRLFTETKKWLTMPLYPQIL